MNPNLISEIQEVLGQKIQSISVPPQGMDSEVFVIKLESSIEYAIKYSKYAKQDFFVLQLLQKQKIDIPVPKVITFFEFENKYVLVMQKIESTLLDLIPVNGRSRYIPSMLKNLKKLQMIKSQKAGFVDDLDFHGDWKDFLLSKYSPNNPIYKWEEVLQRKLVDSVLLKKAIEKIQAEIQNADLPKSDYALLHTDFNQKKLICR